MSNSLDRSHTNKIDSDTGDYINSDHYVGGIPTKSKLPYYLGLFIISPVLGLLSGMVNFRQRSGKIVLILFMGVVGYTIILRPGADSYTITQDFLGHYQYLTFSEFVKEFISIISLQGSGTTVDEPYMSVLSYSVAQFTSNSRWLFAIAGLVYGFFFVRGISLVFSEVKEKWNMGLVVLFIFFISWVTIDGVNAPRNFTGAWVLFCGTYLYHKSHKPKYIFWVLLSPLIHIGYAVMMLPFFGYLVLKHRRYLYLIVLAVSFFASAHMSFLEPILSTTEIGQTKIQQYSGEGWEQRLAENAREDKSFHAAYYETASNLSIQLMLFFSLFFSGYLSGKYHDGFQNALAGIGILLLSFSNFISSVIPVLSNRLFLSFGLIALAYLIRLYAHHSDELQNKKWIIYLCTPAILLYLFTKWSIIGDFLDFKVLFSPLMYPFIGDDPVSMKAFLRQLLGV